MPKATPSPPSSAGSPSPEVVSAALAALQAELADERAARRATEAALTQVGTFVLPMSFIVLM